MGESSWTICLWATDIYFQTRSPQVPSVPCRVLLWLLCSAWWPICSPSKWPINLYNLQVSLWLCCLFMAPLSINVSVILYFSSSPGVMVSLVSHTSIAIIAAPNEVWVPLSWPINDLFFKIPKWNTHALLISYTSLVWQLKSFMSLL